jgi:sugar phosphate isomerase/epimerase
MKKYTVFYFLTLFPLAVCVFHSCAKETKKKDIGLQLWSVRQDMQKDAAKTIEQIGNIGYTFVEAADYSHGKFYGMSPADFKALVEKNNMRFLSSHTSRPVPDSDSWNATMAWWDTCISAHSAAGVRFIVQPSMDSVGYTSLAGLQRYCDYFNEVGRKCRDKGILFGYHNHTREFDTLEGQTIYDYMLQHTDSSLVFFESDLYWMVMGGKNPVDYFTKYPGRFTLWHVKDEKELGASGKMDFKTLFKHAKLAGMKYPIVEQEEFTTTPMEGVKASLDYLQKADFVK